MADAMYEIHCPECGRLLLKVGALAPVETVCRHCKLTVKWPTLKGEAEPHAPKPAEPKLSYR